jgi:hypothetical protein
MEGLSASWIIVPIVSSGSLDPMGSLFDADGTPSTACDNVLLEWAAALELYARGQVKAVMPIIACDEDGNEFSWGLPKTLRELEHQPTLTAAMKHLRKHPSSADLDAGGNLLDKVREMVADVSTDDAAEAGVSVSGVVAAVLRFQGILLTDRADLKTCTDRIFGCAARILNRGGTDDDDGAGGEAAATSISEAKN